MPLTTIPMELSALLVELEDSVEAIMEPVVTVMSLVVNAIKPQISVLYVLQTMNLQVQLGHVQLVLLDNSVQ